MCVCVCKCVCECAGACVCECASACATVRACLCACVVIPRLLMRVFVRARVCTCNRARTIIKMCYDYVFARTRMRVPFMSASRDAYH